MFNYYRPISDINVCFFFPTLTISFVHHLFGIWPKRERERGGEGNREREIERSVGGGGFGDRGEESVGLRWEGPNTSRPSSSSLSISLSSLPPHLHHHPSTRCFCLGLLESFPLVYRDIEGLGAPNCASTPTTQICSLPYYLQKDLFVQQEFKDFGDMGLCI